jgi:hypothetical protein
MNLACKGFPNALYSFVEKSSNLHHIFHGISKEHFGLLSIGVMNFLKRKYAVNAVYGADISRTFTAAWEIISKVDVISAGPDIGRKRYCVLVKYSAGGFRSQDFELHGKSEGCEGAFSFSNSMKISSMIWRRIMPIFNGSR